MIFLFLEQNTIGKESFKFPFVHRDHPYTTLAHFWTFLIQPPSALKVLNVSKKCRFSDSTHPVPLLTNYRDGPIYWFSLKKSQPMLLPVQAKTSQSKSHITTYL